MTRVFRIRSALRAALTMCLLWLPVASAQAQAAAVSLEQREVSLLAAPDTGAATDGHIGQLILIAKDLPSTAGTPASLPCKTGAAEGGEHRPHLQAFCDISGGLQSIKVSYETEYIGRNGAEHRWSITARVDGLPSASVANRYATATIDGMRYWLSIQYKTAADKAATLQVTQPSKRWVVSGEGSRVNLQVLSTGAPTSLITLVHSSLQDSDTNERINVDAFTLCIDTVCGRSVSMPGGKTTPVFLQANALAVPYGEYTGNLTLAADGAALSQGIELTLLATGTDIKVVGVALILLGVMLAWFVTVFAPHQGRRIEALRPAVVLRECAAAWHGKLADADKLTSIVSERAKKALAKIQADLSDAELKKLGYVPGPFPPATTTELQPIETYKIYLKTRSDRLNVIARVVSTGIESIAADWSTYQADSGHRDAAEEALTALDRLSDTAAPGTVDTSIAAVLTKLDGVVKGAGRALRAGRTAGETMTSESLATQLESFNVGVWLIWVAITVASGWAALILTNNGFGSTQDLFTCFGWGLGLQAIGPQLSQLTTTKISKQVKLELPGQ